MLVLLGVMGSTIIGEGSSPSEVAYGESLKFGSEYYSLNLTNISKLYSCPLKLEIEEGKLLHPNMANSGVS